MGLSWRRSPSNKGIIKSDLGANIAIPKAPLHDLRSDNQRRNSLIASDGHHVLSQYELIVDEFLHSRGIPHEVNGYIRKGESLFRYDFKLGDVYIEIWGFNPNSKSPLGIKYNQKRKRKESFYIENDLKLLSIEEKIFQNTWEYIEDYLESTLTDYGVDVTAKLPDYDIAIHFKHWNYWNETTVIKEITEWLADGNELLGFENMCRLGRSDLANAIKEHGGFTYYRTKLGLEPRRKWTHELLLDELKREVNELGHFPSYAELKERERFDLIRKINRSGGYSTIQEELGLTPKRLANASWTDERIIEEYKNLAVRLGKMPTYQDLREHAKTLCSAIDRSKKSLVWFREQIDFIGLT